MRHHPDPFAAGLLIPLLALGIATPIAAAPRPFEGRVHYRTEGAGGAGRLLIALGREGSRVELDLKTASFPLALVYVMPAPKTGRIPTKATYLEPRSKSYLDVDLVPARSSRMALRLGWRLESRVAETVDGRATTHVRAVDQTGNRAEIWIADAGPAAMELAERTTTTVPFLDEELFALLAADGLEGLPVRFETWPKGAATALLRFDLERVETVRPSPAEFVRPKGWSKVAG